MGDLVAKTEKSTFQTFQEKINFWNKYIALYTSTYGNEFDIPLGMRLIAMKAQDPKGLTLLPLVLFPVNPRQFKVEHRKKSAYRYTLGGFVLNHWHPDLSIITASGFIPSFQGKSKMLSASFWYFMELLKLYKSCGELVSGNFQPINVKVDQLTLTAGQQPQIPASEQNVTTSEKVDSTILVPRYSLRNAEINLWYSSDFYTGIFRNFTIEEDEEQPNTLLYSFTFEAKSHFNVVSDSIQNIINSLGISSLTIGG